MLNLMKVITDRLKGSGQNIFFDVKSPSAVYPFTVFNLPNASEGTNIYREDFTLEVDIWTKDLIQCITMTDAIKALMDRWKFRDGNIQVSFYITNTFSILPDEDDQIKRSQVRILAKTYVLGGI